MSSRLAERLRAETRELHTLAERSPFMSTLLRGRMDRSAYVALLRNLQAIYAALEPALRRHAAHPALAALHDPALARSESLRDDLAVVDSGARADDPVQPATLRYVERLRELDAERPELLLAHAYVRYLGDLSGGQLLSGIVARSLGLPSGRGVAFYDFGDADATAALAGTFRHGLATAVIDDEDAVVAEARLAFEWHRRLFEELAAAHGLATDAA
ncbi:MAG: biliverdin-producing heme oxygenase [Burkholderiales bacterium]|nr:biliverdin-producing heme oxygenase [Burkholderiales bacterium]